MTIVILAIIRERASVRQIYDCKALIGIDTLVDLDEAAYNAGETLK